MSWKVGIPNLGHTIDEGAVGEWLVALGDRVRAGDVIAIVETDKANFDIESPGDGVLLAFDARAGATVPVGSVIAYIGGNAGEPVPTQADRTEEPEAQRTPSVKFSGTGGPTSGSTPRAKASPIARRLAQELGVDLTSVIGTGPDGLIVCENVEAAVKGTVPAPAAKGQLMVRWALEAAVEMKKQDIFAEVIDPRTVSPIDWDTICASVERTGRALVVNEATLICSVASEIAATIGERCFGSLDAPVTRIGAPFLPKPSTRALEKHAYPSIAQIVETADHMMPASRQ